MANSFSLDVASFAENFEDGAEQAVRATAIVTFGNIIKLTPVDEGRVRANWFATGENPSGRVDNNKQDNSKDGKTTANAATNIIVGLKAWDTFTLTNNLPYVTVLENGGYPDPVKKGTRINKVGTRKNPITPVYEKRSKAGYSKQAPNGMVRLAIARANRVLELEARKRLPK